MDLSPGNRKEPETFRAGRITTVEPWFIADGCFLIVARAISKSAPGRSFESTMLGERFRVRGGFFKNLSWHFSHGDVKLEHRNLRASPPTIDLPMSPNEFDFRMCREIEEQRMLCAI